MSGGEHCDLEPAVEVRWRKEEEGGGQADVKSNNPHLTGGEKNHSVPVYIKMHVSM